MPRKNKQAAHLSDARNIKKIKSDNELNKKNASSEEEIDYDDFIYETDDSGDEWFNESMFEGLDDDAFNYRLGLPCKAAIYAVKKYRSHRRVPENVIMDGY